MTDLEKVSQLPQDDRVLLMPLVRTTRVFWIWAGVMAAVTLWGRSPTSTSCGTGSQQQG